MGAGSGPPHVSTVPTSLEVASSASPWLEVSSSDNLQLVIQGDYSPI